MIDATRLKAHRTAASLLKKGLFRVASDTLGCVANYMKRLHKGLVRLMILGRGFDLWQVPATT